MSLYNLLFGQNPNTNIVLALIGLKECDIERFRDCGFDDDKIFVYTRTGGGNREDYPNEALTTNPNYLSDQDDDFDNTYATFNFKFPDEIAEDIKLFLEPKKNGIPASIIQQIDKVFSRPKTNGDKWSAVYHSQDKLWRRLQANGQLYETNGYVIVPLSDEAMESLLKAAEENNYPEHEGHFVSMSIYVYKIRVQTEVPRWNFEKDKDMLCRVKIDIGKDWEFDRPMWERYKTKFSQKYPKAISVLEEQYENFS